MDRWSQFANQIDQAFGPNAPRAGNPGQGSGNIPYASGLMSGHHPQDQARQLYGGLHQEQQTNQARAAMQQALGGGGGSGPQPQQQPAQMSPTMQAQLLEYLMSMMMQRAQSGQKSPISSSGGIF